MADQNQDMFSSLPKNIRQIGVSTGSTRVYLEDYVYTYLHMQDEDGEWEHRGFVLLGQIKKEKEFVRYFINGLIRMKDEFFKDGILEFGDGTWAYIYQEMKKYYDNLEIVGWGQDVSGASASLTAELERSHKQNFNIQKNILFLLDLVENEEAFYIYEKSLFQRREGYYVYYEKNPQMQEYMIETRKSRELNIPQKEIGEPLVRSYRETLIDKKVQLATRKWNGVLYTTSLLLVLSVCVLGVNTVNNVEKMQNLETTVNEIAGQVGQAGVLSSDGVPAMSTNTKTPGDSDAKDDEKAKDDKVSDSPDENTARDPDKSGRLDENTAQHPDKSESPDKSSEKGSSPQKNSGQNTDSEKQNGEEQSGGNPDSPDEGADAAADALTEAQTWLLQGYYIVQKGDSMVGISKKIYGTPKKVKKICEINNIEDQDTIYAGQKLELP